MKNKCLLIIITLLVLLLQTACMITKEAADSQTNSNQDIRDAMSDVVNNPDGISVVIERTFSRGTIAAPANDEHFRELAGLLAEIDLSSISEEHEGPNVGDSGVITISVVGVDLLIESSGKSYVLTIKVDENHSYLEFYDMDNSVLEPSDVENNKLKLRGPREAVLNFSAIKAAVDAIRRDDTDLKNCAQITVLSDSGTGFGDIKKNYIVMKSYSAVIKKEFEFTITSTDPIEQISEEDCDLQIVFGDTVYLFNTISGSFIINGNDSYCIDATRLEFFLVHLKAYST